MNVSAWDFVVGHALSRKCQLSDLNGGEIAAEIRITTRQLARWGCNGVLWGRRKLWQIPIHLIGKPETHAWIDERNRFREGNREWREVTDFSPRICIRRILT